MDVNLRRFLWLVWILDPDSECSYGISLDNLASTRTPRLDGAPPNALTLAARSGL